jgi:gliding motility-associated-like protein
LLAGQYIITVTDSNGCVLKDTAIIGQPGALASVATVSNVLCFGDSSGAASVVITGGTVPYTYLWTNGQTTSAASGFSIGTYTVAVTDSNGCVLIVPVTITQPTALVSLVTPTPASCSGFNNGTATANVIGGSPPYTYLWSATAGSQTTQTATGLPGGVYYITVIDSNGCVKNDSVQILEISPITLLFNNQNASCYGSGNGTIDLSVTGGTQPYTYVWSTGETTQDIVGLFPGTYSVTVLDSNGCYKSTSVVITQPDSISATYVEYFYANGFNVSLHGSSDGSVDLTVTGGTAPYNIFWSTGDSTEDLSFVPAGEYYVQITDSNGCIVILHMTLTEPYELEMPTGVSPNGDGINDYFVIHGLESYPDNELRIYNRWGNLVYSADDYKQNWDGHSNNGGELPEATYFVVLKIFGTNEITLTGYVDLRR